MSKAHDFFNSFVDKKSIKISIKNKQEEGLYLEFKTKHNRSNPDLEPDDKKNFADGLSMFANSDGGVQIWGIKTKKDSIDFASEIKPITEVDVFASNLRNFLKDAVVPSVDGVIIEVIFENKKEKTGYVKILIPQSDKTPHRSQVSREYLKRNQIGRIRLEHFDLEDMFGRRQKPFLSLLFSSKKMLLNPHEVDSNGYYPNYEIDLSIFNSGRATARDVMLILFGTDSTIMPITVKVPNTQVSYLNEHYGGRQVIQLNFRGIFYPNIKTNIGSIVTKIHKDFVKREIIKLEWKLFADNMLEKNGEQYFLLPSE